MADRTGVSRMVLDTDMYNEKDDQFALVHALLAPEIVEVEAIYAAPFHNSRSDGPADGMHKSFAEVHRVLRLMPGSEIPVFEGSEEWLTDSGLPKRSAATDDLIERALSPSESPLYVVGIAAPTNAATAIRLAPEIADRIIVVWLGGNSLDWPTADEFNLRQDLVASQVLFDSGVPLVHVPCLNVASQLAATREEIEARVRPAGLIGEFLAGRFAEYVVDEIEISKVIWDLAAVGWLLNPSWTTTEIVDSPILTDDMTWSPDERRHLIGEVTGLRRDSIFEDLFGRLAGQGSR
jgi:purine nucleosidase